MDAHRSRSSCWDRCQQHEDAISALTVQREPTGGDGWDDLVRLWEETDGPEGCKSNASHDRIAKAAGYAQAGIPLYLLIDAHAPGGATITLYGEPGNAVYRVLQAGKFGETFHLPAPFDLKPDTSVFPTP
ncbi:hypothetical protein ACFY04_34745 [Streptomyces sp. NPDC001549]|uniref:hypothetical protein n=1 Tax=Streptomyces sp. NPDC001549 TaxID=3364586 RepID=UPI0036AABF69